MFEFWKRISKEEKIKKLHSSNVVHYVASKELRKEINDWKNETYGRNMDFSELLYKLGFDKDRTLYLERIPDMDNISIRYGYDKNIVGNERIDLCVYETGTAIGRYKPYEKKITLSGDGYKKVFNIGPDFKLKLRCDNVIKNIDGNKYERSLDIENFIMNSLDDLRIVYYNDLSIKDGYYDEIIINVSKKNILEVDNEDMLIDYLGSITRDDTVEEVYKKICEISLGEDDEYKKIKVVLKRLGKEEAKLTYGDGVFFSSLTPKKAYQVISEDRSLTYERYLPNKYYNLYMDYIGITVLKGNYCFVLHVKPKNYVDGMKLDNELELRDYLCGLEFPISIEDVYKKICEISLGDVYEYSEIRMKCYYEKNVILSLSLENGEFKSYQVNKDGKEISIDNNGNFMYVNNSNKRERSIDMKDDIVTKCLFVSENGIESDDMGNSIYGAINEARDVKVRTKKMIDNLMNRNNS